MGVLAVGALAEPLHDVEAGRTLEREGVAVEDVNDDSIVAVSGELVGHKLAVLPDAEDVWNVQQGSALVLVATLGLGDVGVELADLDDATGRLTTGGEESELALSSVLSPRFG